QNLLLGLSNCDDMLSIYVGDNRTDEDAFKALKNRNCGYGILVLFVPKESNAFTLSGVHQKYAIFCCTIIWSLKL
ncbi:hypothetical protein RCOM_0416440, partial [Ricinus communis]